MAGPFTQPRDRPEARGQEFGERQNPYLPPGPKPIVFEQFEGVNTNTTRPGVPDNQCWWIDGFIPLAPRNLRTLYGIGTVAYTASGTTVVFFDFANIGSTPIMVVFLANGSVVQVNMNTLAATTILAAATISAPSITTCGMSQWGNEYVIIVADQTNGYWLWNGTVVFKAGSISPVITVTDTGGYYSTAPTAIITGGSGSATSLGVSVSNGQVVSVSVINPGSGYVATDSVSVGFVGSVTSGSGATISVTSLTVFATIGGGTGSTLASVSAMSISAGGSNYGQPTLVFTSIATSADATALATTTNGTITSTSITNGGAYFVNGSFATIYPTVSIVDVGVTASASVELMPYGVQGHAVETYSGHVWVADGATLYFTAPGSVSDFSTSNGGGNATSNDSNLKVQYTQLIANNGFLYLIADSSSQYISGVQTSGTITPVTTYTQQTADAEVGTPYPQSVIAFGRNVLFANSYGIHGVFGGSVRKVSEMLDGVYSSVASFGGLQLSAAQATLFGNRTWMILIKLVDPTSGSTVNRMMMWDGDKKWWSSGQEITLTYIKHQEINSVITAYGTNGTVIHPLFQNASASLSKVVQSRLYDAPGGFLFNKAGARFWGLAEYYSTVSPNFSISVDNEYGTIGTLTTITGPSSVGFFVSEPQAIGQKGRLSGLTIKTSAADMAIISTMLQEHIIEYRG